MFDTIKSRWIAARRERAMSKSSFLATLVSDISMVAKNDGQRSVTEKDCIAVVRKYIKNLELTISAFDGTPTELLEQKAILESFLPQQMNETEISVVVDIIVSGIDDPSPRSMGAVMGELGRQYAGQFDGQMASKIVKEKLSKL